MSEKHNGNITKHSESYSRLMSMNDDRKKKVIIALVLAYRKPEANRSPEERSLLSLASHYLRSKNPRSDPPTDSVTLIQPGLQSGSPDFKTGSKQSNHHHAQHHDASPADPGAQSQINQADIEDVYTESIHNAEQAIQASQSSKPTFLRKLKETVKRPAFIVVTSFLVFIVFFARPYRIPSGSMEPTLMPEDRIFSIARYFPNGSTYHRGDVVCFKAPTGETYVKRVIGVGGDHIRISGEKVMVNGQKSPYQGTGGVMSSFDLYLADDEYWVMGDNRANSYDSRFIGPVKADKMISKVYFIYMPASRITML